MKKYLALLLALILLAGLCATPASAEDIYFAPPIPSWESWNADNVDRWNGTTTMPTKTIIRDGEEYYRISTCEELAYIAADGNEEWLGYNYVLTRDLILNDVNIVWDEEGTCINTEGELKQWRPIGPSYDVPFSGKFDGQGHTISGLYINTPRSTCGLFGYCEFASVTGLFLVNSYVKGRRDVGSVVAYAWGTDISYCVNYGLVSGSDSAGGIIGYISSRSTLSNCANFGPVLGPGNKVGGIIGNIDHPRFISACINYGPVSGNINAGGIAGYASCGSNFCLSDCANLAPVAGGDNVGGIVGKSKNVNLSCCYNIGAITASDGGGLAGGISGNSDHCLDDSSTTITNCYYAKDTGLNEIIYAFGNHNLADDEENVAEPKTLAQLKVQSTFVNWDFPRIWSINEGKNCGYPYPVIWMDPGETIPQFGISLSRHSLSLAKGDVVYLTAVFSPVYHSSGCVWTSSDESVATVSANGRVELKKAGNVRITVTTMDGGFTDSCYISVSPRTGNDYLLDELGLMWYPDDLDHIPEDDELTVSLSVTKLAEAGNAIIALATYGDNGRFLGIQFYLATDLSQNDPKTLDFIVENSGDIRRIKAFAISSLSDLTPLAPAVQFPAG